MRYNTKYLHLKTRTQHKSGSLLLLTLLPCSCANACAHCTTPLKGVDGRHGQKAQGSIPETIINVRGADRAVAGKPMSRPGTMKHAIVYSRFGQRYGSDLSLLGCPWALCFGAQERATATEVTQVVYRGSTWSYTRPYNEILEPNKYLSYFAACSMFMGPGSPTGLIAH